MQTVSHAYKDLKYILCNDEQDDHKHILHCKVILEALKPVDVECQLWWPFHWWYKKTKSCYRTLQAADQNLTNPD